MLGFQRGRARRRHHGRTRDSSSGFWSHERGQGRLRRVLFCMRRHGAWWRRMLGRQHVRRARKRVDDEQLAPGAGRRSGERRGCDLGRRLLRLLGHRGRWRRMLGRQQARHFGERLARPKLGARSRGRTLVIRRASSHGIADQLPPALLRVVSRCVAAAGSRV